MGDALCGPSNPLQQFKQQTQLDRTLQQDRLASRASPSQGFRSANQNAGLLDPEFEAFQAGLPAPDLPQFNHLQRPPQYAGPSSQPSWATDFQRMAISPPPALQQQRMSQASPINAGWAQGFQQHIAQTAPKAQQSAPSPQAFQYMARYGMNGYQSNFAQPSFVPAVQSKGKEVATEHWDDAAFDRIFDQVSDAMAVEEEAMDIEQDVYAKGASTGNTLETETEAYDFRQHQEELHHMEHMVPPEAFQRLDDGDVLDKFDFDSFLRETTAQEQQKQAEDDDALAKTAEELLEKVEHNQSDKFRNSQFLSLMRKLRDREMKVEGNDMVETNAAASVTTTEKLATDLPVFDNSEQTPQAISDPVDFAPPDAIGRIIPPHEQDHDAGRFDPRDGQAVVDLLNEPLGAHPDDIGTLAASHSPPTRSLPQGVFYGDLRPLETATVQHPSSPMEMAYGVDGRSLHAGPTQLIDWKSWNLQSPGYRSHQSAQPPPGLH